MKCVAISPCDEVSYRQLDRSSDQLVRKIQWIWSRIYTAPLSHLIRIICVPRDAIRAMIRDLFFFPLKCSFIVSQKAVKEQIALEDRYCKDFWDPSKPLDPIFQYQAEIRELSFKDQTYTLQLQNEKKVKITCRIIETKGEGEPVYTFALILGSLADIHKSVGAVYPYLAAYLRSKKNGTPLPPARFILISENNLDCKPSSMDEAGLILLETLKTLKQKFGDIDQIVAHSLGCIFLAHAMRYADNSNEFAKRICFDRGPISIQEASKKYFGGRLLFLFASAVGWITDTEQNIVDFYQKCKEKPHFVVVGVKEDHRFSGSANLCYGKKIKKIQDIQTLAFSPPRQVVHDYGLHSLRTDFLNSVSLEKQSGYLRPSENLADAIIRHSLPPIKEQQLSIASYAFWKKKLYRARSS